MWSGGQRLAVGGGIGTVILVVAYLLLGGDPQALFQSQQQVIETEQTEKGKTERNNRLIAVAAESHTHASLRSLSKLEPKLLDEIEHFFASYNEARGKQFKPLARKGPGVGQTIDRKVTAEKEAALRRSSTP